MVYVELDQARGKELAKERGVMGSPTILLLDSAGNQVNGLRGAETQFVLEQAVKDLLARNATTDLE